MPKTERLKPQKLLRDSGAFENTGLTSLDEFSHCVEYRPGKKRTCKNGKWVASTQRFSPTHAILAKDRSPPMKTSAFWVQSRLQARRFRFLQKQSMPTEKLAGDD